MLRTVTRIVSLFLLLAGVAAPASAQIIQSLHLGGGLFVPRGYYGRAKGDVLVEDHDSLTFADCQSPRRQSCIQNQFTGGQVFGEWLVAFGDHVEFGAGVGIYGRHRPTVYTDYTHDASKGFSEIEQELGLRVVPVTGLVRFLGGRPGTIQPYFGVGISALNYHYTESGEFIDFNELTRSGAFVTFTDHYVAKGTAIGSAILGGVRVPVNGDVWGITLEWRYQRGVGKTGGLPSGFLAEKIDLGGNNFNVGVLMRF